MHCRTLSNNCSKSSMKTKKCLFVQGNLDVYPHHVVDPSHKIAQQWEALPCAWLAFSWQLERPCTQHVFFQVPQMINNLTVWEKICGDHQIQHVDRLSRFPSRDEAQRSDIFVVLFGALNMGGNRVRQVEEPEPEPDFDLSTICCFFP